MATNFALSDQHILIVDDNSSNRLIIEMILHEHGLKNTYKAASVLEAYSYLENSPIDAILLDVMMPDIGGIQACKTIRSQSIYDTIPIIMVTANDDNETFRKSFKVGANDFISKPINDVVLLSRLASQLEKQQMHKTIISQSRFSAMGEVISMLAHQWRQPLGVINAISTNIRIKMELDIAKKTDIRHAFDDIEQNLDQLSLLITNFKSSFGSTQKNSCTDITNTIHDVLRLHKQHIQELDINLTTAIESVKPSNLAKQAIIQVLVHLLTNCFETFTQNSIENPSIHISLVSQDDFYKLIIKDNGAGISEKDLPFIFDPYFSAKSEKNGKGLGLYFAKQLTIQQLDGSLTITSNEEGVEASVLIKIGALC